MLKKLFDFRNLGEDYKNFYESVDLDKKCSVFKMSFSERILSSVNGLDKVLYVTADSFSCQKAYSEFQKLLGNGAVMLPPGTDLVMYKEFSSPENNRNRLITAHKILNGEAKVVVATIDSLAYLMPKVETFSSSVLKIKVNTEIDLNNTIQKLVAMGYKREQLVQSPGYFAVRGGTLDIYPINSDYPVRIELFDTLVETMKLYDPLTQSTLENKKEIVVCLATNVVLTATERDETIKKLQLVKSTFISKEEEDRQKEIIQDIIIKLENGDTSFTLDFIFPLIKNTLGSIFDYISGFTIVIDECKMVYDSMTKFYTTLEERKKLMDGYAGSLSCNRLNFLKKQELIENINKFKLVAHQKLTTANKFFNPDKVFSFRSSPIIRYVNNLDELSKDIFSWLENNYKIFIAAGDEKQAKSIQKRLENKDIYLDIKTSASLKDNSSCILPYEFSTGFVLPSEKIVIIGTYDIFPIKNKPNKVLTSKRDLGSVPKIGDYVVHHLHGIGKCEGVTKLSGSFGVKDFIVVAYRGEDKLYVPIDQMDMLEKYSGGGEPKRLSKIGGQEFGQTKEKVKKQIKEMAFSLLKLYAEREEQKGFVYPKDDELQIEFENKFPYTETEDQLIAINEIKQDMERGKVMERLVCGDVGFGKTEVALRAIFKAIVAGKQVMLLAPTTILARQHYNTAKARLEPFGVRIESLDRFRTAKETKEVLEKLKNHKVDLVCGTHRLLSKDVVFDDLGLVVLDEEQKFGVEHKEKLKLDHKTLDVLTLSATPIPRTMHMSLSGIRDISVISTPPRERIPVQTYVTEYSDGLVRDAIKRELSRDGQVFFVYNRVETIYAFAEKIRNLVPDAKILVAHGQLSSSELEDVIYKFYNHMADVLICTTIIENGIDLPSANTLVVYDSDKFGLSQLYQIRGRVGRGTREGYAYFTYKPDKSLSEDSYKRLDAIAEFTEFGSGFKIAMKDLEIRGSGNIFGAEQHGHIEKVGYELYSKMLKNAVKELKGQLVEEERDVVMKISLDAFLPEDYISSSEDRMTIYKSIAHISSFEDKKQIKEELEEKYGILPTEVVNLIEISYTKSLAKQLGASEVYLSSTEMKLVFDNDAKVIKTENFAKALLEYKDKCVLFLMGLPIIKFKNLNKLVKENLLLLQQFLISATQK